MKLSLLPLPRLLRPRWPRRELRAVLPRSEPGLVLRVFRGAALTTISFIITAADSAAFAESYRGLWLWARHHGLSGFWAAAFPLQVDTFIVVGELALFVAMIDQWTRRHKAGAWAMTLLGLAASVAGNIGHVAAHDLQSRGTAAVPPVAAFAAMWVGLSVLKRVIARADETVPSDDEFVAEEPVARVPLTVVPDVVSSPLPSDAETAAAAALWATLAAGNPLSLNQLQSRFRLTRKEATEVRSLVLSGVRASAKRFTPSDIPPAPLVSAITLAAGRHVRVGRPVSPSLIAGMLMRPLTAVSPSVPASRVVRLSRQFSVRLPGTGGYVSMSSSPEARPAPAAPGSLRNCSCSISRCWSPPFAAGCTREWAMNWTVEILAVEPVAAFEFRWPEGTEAFEGGWLVNARIGGSRHKVRHGLGARPVYGRERVHTVTWVDGAVQVEGVEADDYPVSQSLVSRLRRPGRKTART